MGQKKWKAIRKSEPLKLNASQEKAMRKEINKQIIVRQVQYNLDFESVCLWVLNQHFGFGKKRLAKFFNCFTAEYKRMCDLYEQDDAYAERYILKQMGVDIEKWDRENKAE